MAKRTKSDVAPIVAVPVAVPSNAVPVSATPAVPANNAVVAPTPADNANPAVQPIVSYPSAPIATTPAVLPKVSAPTFAESSNNAVVEFNNAVTEAFKDATARMNDLGALADDVLQCEFNAAKTWSKSAFDATFSNLRDQYVLTYPDSAADVRAADWWKYHRFIRACNDLGILGADSLPFGVTVNHLFPAAIEMIQAQATAQVREGWAEWLKTIVPMIVRRELSREIIVGSIDAQRLALNEFDAKRFPIKASRGGAARKGKTGSGRKNGTKKTKAAPTPNTPAAPTPNNAVVGTKPAPTPADNATKPAPTPNNAVVGATTPADLKTFLASLTTDTQWAELAKLLSEIPSDARLMTIYKTLTPRVRAIKEAREAKQASAA